MNAFVCSMKSYYSEEVGSGDYLVAIVINAFVFYLEVGLEPPLLQKEQKLGGKKFLKKTSISS